MRLEIDTSDPVLVTGATGFLAGWIVKQLVDAGATVHAAVRDPADHSKCGHLRTLSNTSKGKIELFKADLLDDGSYAEAMKNCRVVIHTASPFITNYNDAQKFITPTSQDGRNRQASYNGKTARAVSFGGQEDQLSNFRRVSL